MAVWLLAAALWMFSLPLQGTVTVQSFRKSQSSNDCMLLLCWLLQLASEPQLLVLMEILSVAELLLSVLLLLDDACLLLSLSLPQISGCGDVTLILDARKACSSRQQQTRGTEGRRGAHSDRSNARGAARKRTPEQSELQASVSLIGGLPLCIQVCEGCNCSQTPFKPRRAVAGKQVSKAI